MVSKNRKKRIIVNAVHAEECRVAILNGDELEDIHIETAALEQSRGNIYKGVVVRVEPGLQAAFVEFEKGRKHGFLQFRDIRPEYYKKRENDEGGGRPRIQDVIFKKQELLVQVEKDARDQKGASLTTHISLPGRYMVMMPGQSRVGISRKIQGHESRDRIRGLMKKLEMPEDAGIIVRTSGLDQDEETLRADLEYLDGLWKGITARAEEARAPSLINEEEDLVIRAIRDYLTDEIGEIVIDNAEVCQRAREYFKAHIPKYQRLVKQHRLRKPIFSRFGVEVQLSQIHERQAPLPSGGTIVIDSGEALTAIDVNSGKTRGEKDIEDLALRTNLEAAREIGRQLRLRDAGGLIVIDFIDMKPMKNRRAVEQELQGALRLDKAKTDIARISKFGMLEMSRQRLRPSLESTSFVTCPTCRGLGRHKSPEATALSVLRELQSAADEEHLRVLRAATPVETANYLLNTKREDLLELEKKTGASVTVEAADVLPGQYRIVIEREGAEPEMRDSLAHEEENGKPKKKKRRARGRKKSRAAETVTAGSTETAAAVGETPMSEKKTETAEATTGESESTGEPGTGEAKKSRRRRSRRRKKSERPAAAAQQATAPGEEPPAQPAGASEQKPETGDSVVAVESSEEKKVVAKKPARKRRPRRPRAAASLETKSAELPNETVASGSEAPAADGEAASAEEPAKKAPRRKSGTRKKSGARARTGSRRRASDNASKEEGGKTDGTTEDT